MRHTRGPDAAPRETIEAHPQRRDCRLAEIVKSSREASDTVAFRDGDIDWTGPIVPPACPLSGDCYQGRSHWFNRRSSTPIPYQNQGDIESSSCGNGPSLDSYFLTMLLP